MTGVLVLSPRDRRRWGIRTDPQKIPAEYFLPEAALAACWTRTDQLVPCALAVQWQPPQSCSHQRL